jgi:RNA recognition motif-containing protein
MLSSSHPNTSLSPSKVNDESNRKSTNYADMDGSVSDRDEREAANPGNQVYIRGLSFRTTEDELRSIFERYGTVCTTCFLFVCSCSLYLRFELQSHFIECTLFPGNLTLCYCNVPCQ